VIASVEGDQGTSKIVIVEDFRISQVPEN